MKVAILLNEMTARGGAPRQALALALSLEQFGHEATIYAARYCRESCYPDLAASLNVRAIERVSAKDLDRRRPERHHGLLSGVRRHFLESRALARMVEEDRPEILNPHVRGATRAAVLCKRRTGAPVVWMCDDARHWEQPGYRPYYSPPVQWLFDRVMARAERPVVREVDRIIALDTRVERILRGYYGRPVEVVRSGLDIARFHPKPEARFAIRARHGFADEDFVLLWLGILEPHRRLEDAIEAVRLARQHGRARIRFLIAGTSAFAPGYARQLDGEVRRYKLDREVHFHFAPIAENEMADYYSSADALVYLAENQCWGLGVFEAMACGLPAIVSQACGAHEVLEHQRTAMIVPPRDAAALALAIAELEDSPSLRSDVASRARAEVLARMTWESYARNMLRVFEAVLDARRGRTAAHAREAFA